CDFPQKLQRSCSLEPVGRAKLPPSACAWCRTYSLRLWQLRSGVGRASDIRPRAQSLPLRGGLQAQRSHTRGLHRGPPSVRGVSPTQGGSMKRTLTLLGVAAVLAAPTAAGAGEPVSTTTAADAARAGSAQLSVRFVLR